MTVGGQEAAGVKPCWAELSCTKTHFTVKEYCLWTHPVLCLLSVFSATVKLNICYIYTYVPLNVEPSWFSFPTPPTRLKLHHKSLSQQQQQSFSIQGSWYSFPVHPCACLLLSLQHFTTPFTINLCDAVYFYKVSCFHLLLLTEFCFFYAYLSVDLKIKHSGVSGEKRGIACTCVYPQSCSLRFTCNFVETTAGKSSATTVSFTYCITLGWIHMLHASCAATMSGELCLPFSHIAALWQVSYTSQVGCWHAHTAVSYCYQQYLFTFSLRVCV